MGDGDHFGAEAEARMLEQPLVESMRRKHEAYEKIMLRPRGRRLFVFTGQTDLHFDPQYYQLAKDKDVQRDPLVKELLRDIEELKKQLPVRRQCVCCGVTRSVECFSQQEDICDKCNLANVAEEHNEESTSRILWQERATRLGVELRVAREAMRSSEALATQRKYERDKIKNELMSKKLAMELTTAALERVCSFIRGLPHKLTCPRRNPKSELPCTCGIDVALGRQPEKKLT